MPYIEYLGTPLLLLKNVGTPTVVLLLAIKRCRVPRYQKGI